MHIRQPTVAELLAHAPWVRQLAGELVGDASRADDVAQDAMLAALQRPPRPGNVRGWLATVVTNATRAQRRADRRRAARERRAARPEREPATADVVARAGVHRQLVTLVLELEEPFRTVILLRFFDGLTVPDIAARLSIPTKTVHSRLARGVERLRGHLDAQHGERHVWIAALAPLLDPSARATALAAASGAMVMHSKTKLFGLLATLAVAGAATLPWMLRQSSPSDGLPNVPATVAADHAALDATPAPTPAPPRTIVEPEPPPPSAPAAIVLGVVLGPDGQELPNFAVALARGGKHMTQTTTDASGRFELAVTEREGTIVADQPGWTTVAAGMLWADDKPCALLVAPAIEIGGHVFDEQGLPVPSAVVELRLGRGFDLRFDAILEASQRQAWRTKSDARGAFHLPAAPETDAGQLVASSAGFDELVQPAPSQSDLGLRLTLERQGTPTLRGEVVDPAGARLAGAWVGLGGRVTRTEADGTFSIQLDDEVRRARTLRAVAKGFAPAVQEALGPVPWPDFVRLALVELAAPIAGRVVDERGEPVAARVWLEDPTSLGDHDGLPTHAEFISDGAPAETDDDGRSPLWSWVSTDASGRFQIGGLTTRTYQLRAATEDLLTTRSPPIAAGATDVLLVIDRSARFARVAGVVRSISGEPLPGVHVASSAEGFSADCVDGSSVSQGLSGPSTATDAEGRFELPGLPKEGAYLQFFSADAESAFHPLSPDDDAAQLSIQMRARCHFRVEPLQPEAGNLGANFALLDDLDQPIAVTLQRPGTKVSATGFDLTDGRSPVLRAGEGRFTLLVRGAFGERRSSVWLRPGDVNVLHY